MARQEACPTVCHTGRLSEFCKNESSLPFAPGLTHFTKFLRMGLPGGSKPRRGSLSKEERAIVMLLPLPTSRGRKEMPPQAQGTKGERLPKFVRDCANLPPI